MSKRVTCDAEYAKDAKIKKQDIDEIMNWIREQPRWPDVTEYMTIQFYHVSDYNKENTKQLMDKCYSFKTNAMELFNGKDYDRQRYDYNFWDIYYCIASPKATPRNYRMLYIGLKDFSSSKYDFQILLNMSLKGTLALMFEKGTCPGYSVVFDVQGYSFGHLLAMHISLVKKFMYFIQEVVPIKVKEIHVINIHSIFDKIMMLMKPFLKKELFDIIHIHSNIEDFYEAVSKDIVPKDLGGNLPFTRDDLLEEMKSKVDIYEMDLMEELEKRKEPEKSNGSIFSGWKLF